MKKPMFNKPLFWTLITIISSYIAIVFGTLSEKIKNSQHEIIWGTLENIAQKFLLGALIFGVVATITFLNTRKTFTNKQMHTKPIFWTIASIFFGCIATVCFIIGFKVENSESNIYQFVLMFPLDISGMVAVVCGLMAIALILKARKLLSGIAQILLLLLIAFILLGIDLAEINVHRNIKSVEAEKRHIKEVIAKSLNINPNELTEDDYKKVLNLNFELYPISDIKSLAKLTNLQTLDLLSTNASDIKPLANLTNLQTLFLSGPKVTDIAPIANLKNLTKLSLYCSISDIKPLENLTNVQTLSLSGSNVTDIKTLENLTNLQTLSLSGSKIINIAPIANLKNLTKLSLYCRNSDIKPLENMENLQELHIPFNKHLNNIEPLANLTNLITLDLGSTNVSNIKALENLVNLQKLNLAGTKVSDINSLGNLRNLTHLFLTSTQVSNIEPLINLTYLQELSLSGSNVSDISVLANLPKLQKLNFSNTKVSDEQVAELKKALPNLKIDPQIGVGSGGVHP
jgi:Leucine-rich repeat (LRR) protein